jgi:TDG/mug DNA glycosylase family protein
MYPRPSKEQLRAAAGRITPDLIAPGMRVLFCGINPSLYSAVVGHHFARPGNRFWPALHQSGFTPRLLRPWEEAELLTYGYGITNVFERATATAAELSNQDLLAGGERLREKVRLYKPRVLAVLGITAYRTAFHRPHAALGLQEETIGGTHLWVLPNPSGLNAHFQLPELAAVYRELRQFVEGLEVA